MNAAICKTTDNSTGSMPDKTKKIMVSDFTTFNSYFFDRKHGNMKRQIYNYLNHELELGEFSHLTGFEILTDRITAKCCKLEKLRYRGIDRTTFYTDMDVHLLLDTPEKAFCWKGMLRCLCGFYPEFSCTIVGLSDKYDHEGLTRLTSYLVPVYSNFDVEHAAEQIWSWYGMKNALTDPEARNAKTLARRMGLSIQYLPVYEHDGIDSMVFFSDGELTVGYDFTIEEDEKKVRFKDRIKQEMKIPANTIVINTNCVKKEYSKFNIFHVYTINECSLQKLCDKSGRLRDLIDSRKYIHADGHVVRNLPDYVRTIAGETLLTDWANAHVDECCLRFRRQYVQNRTGSFVLGRLCFDPEYIQRTLDFLSPVMTQNKIDEISAKMQYKMKFMTGDLAEEFDSLMHLNNDTRESLSEKLNISDKTLKRALDDPAEKMPLDMIVAICLIWKLPDWLSMMLLKKTYNSLQDFDRRHQAIDYVLRAMWDSGIDEANNYLRSLHLNELAYPKK